MNEFKIAKLLMKAGLALIVVVFLLIFKPWSIIGAGEIGVVTLFGEVQPRTLSPGIHIINPISSVHKINIRVLTTKAHSEAASNDLQKVNTEITLNFSINGQQVKKIYSTMGDNIEVITASIINPAMSEAFKQAVATYSAEQLITKRDVVSALIQNILQNRLNKYGILVSNISITDFQFSQAFNQAIENKMVAQQNVQTAQNKLAQARVDAEQMIITAKAQADSMKTQQQVLTAELLQKMAIEKWNGELPQYMGTNMPFINFKGKQ